MNLSFVAPSALVLVVLLVQPSSSVASSRRGNHTAADAQKALKGHGNKKDSVSKIV